MKLSNKTYDVLMVLAQIILPGAGTLYAALSGIWGLPATEQVLGSIAAVDTFLGGVLKILSNRYTPPAFGNIVVDDNGPTTKYRIDLPGSPEEVLAKHKVVTLGIVTGKID